MLDCCYVATNAFNFPDRYSFFPHSALEYESLKDFTSENALCDTSIWRGQSRPIAKHDSLPYFPIWHSVHTLKVATESLTQNAEIFQFWAHKNCFIRRRRATLVFHLIKGGDKSVWWKSISDDRKFKFCASFYQ